MTRQATQGVYDALDAARELAQALLYIPAPEPPPIVPAPPAEPDAPPPDA
jgi:hypothetical protein